MNLFRFLIPCYTLFITSCSLTPIVPEEVESLTFYTTLRDFETTHSIQDYRELLEWNRDSLNGGMICRDSVIKNRSSIETFVRFVNALRPGGDSYDLRTVVSINFKNKESRHVGFGRNWGTCYEGKSMRDNDELFKFLEDSIYSKHSKSYWGGSWMKAMQSGDNDYVNDDLTGIRAYTELKLDTPPLFNGDTNGFHREFNRIAHIMHEDGDTTKRMVEVQFIIDKKGNLIGPRISDKEMNQLNEEEKQVIMVLKQIQNWTPGTYNGETVDVFLTRYLSY